MAFLGQIDGRDSQFPLLDLIKADKYVGWENLIPLAVIRLSYSMKWAASVAFADKK